MAAPASSVYIGWLGTIRFESSAAGAIFPVPSTFMDSSTSILAITSTAVTSTVQFLAPATFASSAGYGFSDDIDSGLFLTSAGAVGMTIAGTERMLWTSSAVTSTVPGLWPDGVVGAPAHSFSGEATTGLYRSGAGTISFAGGGTRTAFLSGTTFATNSITLDVANQDVSLSRGAANRLDLASGDSFQLTDGPLLAGPGTDLRLRAGSGAGVALQTSDGTPRWSMDSSGNLDGAGVYLGGTEQTAPAAPAANGFRIFAQDNGAGKTQLMVIFSSGAAQQIAIQP